MLPRRKQQQQMLFNDFLFLDLKCYEKNMIVEKLITHVNGIDIQTFRQQGIDNDISFKHKNYIQIEFETSNKQKTIIRKTLKIKTCMQLRIRKSYILLGIMTNIIHE